MIVLDSGAVIALAKLEKGALFVRQQLRANPGACFIHAVNVLEVFYGFERANGTAYAERILALMDKAQIQTRGDFDRDFLRDASGLKTTYRMSLADTFAVALARRLGVPLLSSDHHELDPVNAAGVCPILFIR